MLNTCDYVPFRVDLQSGELRRLLNVATTTFQKNLPMR